MPSEVLKRLIADYPDMLAVVVVVQTADEGLVAASGGCTVLETVGMFHFGVQSASNRRPIGVQESGTALAGEAYRD